MSAPMPDAGVVAPRYKLVIFDFDGTLADSGDWFLSIADDLAERFRFRQVAPDEIEGLRGHTTREVIRYLGIPRWKLPIIARHLHKRLASETHKIALFGGVEAMLATLQSAGVRLALVTSNAEENARAILGPDNMARFEQVECGASLFGKAPRYRRVLKRAGLIAGDILSVGDETRDITAARKVGIDAAAVLWGYARRDALTALDPQLLFDSPDDVIASVLGARG
ncbi:HAD hydrolase-like protein [Sphingomonas sp.]|uniref:HAD hydrolase-like protein n=2 Tax=Sphingomonas sp. TaxID=28214 RepID=UPI0035A99C0D